MSPLIRNGCFATKLLLLALALLAVLSCSGAAASDGYGLVSAFGSEGRFNGEFYGPTGIAINATGYIYVADQENSRIQVFTPSGGFATAFGSNGSAAGELYEPAGIALNSTGYVYVADVENNRIAVFSPSGAFITVFGSPGDAPGELSGPLGVAVNSTGYVYVADTDNDRIQVFGPDGAFVREFAGGIVHEELDGPNGIATSPTGEVYVTDGDNGQVQVFTPSGAFVRAFPVNANEPLSIPIGIAIASSGGVLVTELSIVHSGPEVGRVRVFTPSGTILTSFGPSTAEGYPYSLLFGVAEAPNGDIYVTEYFNCRVLIYRRGTYDGPSAAFSAYPETGQAPLTVQFSDMSVGAESWTWVFGDGTYSSSRNPSHVFTEPGTYTVSLLVSDGSGRSASKVARDLIRVIDAPPTADFSANRTSGTAPLAVAFAANTTVATSWQWYFGDGEMSAEKDPVHVYATPGRYTVWLVASAPGYGSVTAHRDAFITVAEEVVVDFGADRTTGAAPLAVAFSDLTAGTPLAWRWEFGDGTTANQRNATHVYSKAGTYGVNLTVWTASGSATASKPAFVSVEVDPRAPVANFSLSRTSGTAPLYVKFTDASTGSPTSWRWDFGGLAWTTATSPSVVFRQPGTYPITLVATNAYGSSTVIKNLTVTGAMPRSVPGSAVSVVG